MRSEELASDDRRERRLDDVEGDVVEVVTGDCVSETAVDSADALHGSAAVKSHVDWFDELS